MLVLLGVASVSPLTATAQVICTVDVKPSVIVVIIDSATGAPLAERASGMIAEGTYSDSLRPYLSTSSGVLLSRKAGEERAGTYHVTVVHSGYAAWDAKGIKVRRDECHVGTAVIQAKLRRLPKRS